LLRLARTNRSFGGAVELRDITDNSLSHTIPGAHQTRLRWSETYRSTRRNRGFPDGCPLGSRLYAILVRIPQESASKVSLSSV
jgi:hypothetical protein